jgi:hypothetical protein
VIQDDPRLLVTVEREVQPSRYTHPIDLTGEQVGAILREFSIIEKQRVDASWSPGTRPKRLFSDGEVDRLAPVLAEGLKKAGPEDRVYFEVRAKGNNALYDRDVVAGWMAARDPYLYLKIEHFHTQMPMTNEDPYFKSPRYPSLPPAETDYILYFRKDGLWGNDPQGTPSLDYRRFLSAEKTGQTGDLLHKLSYP